MTHLILLALWAVFVNNVIFARFLGICPYLGVSKRLETAVGMSLAVIFVMTVSSTLAWAVQTYVLVPLGVEYLQTIVFILFIASLVQLVEMVIQKSSPPLYTALGIFLPLITTNCAVLGVAILSIQNNFSLVETMIHALGASVGFGVAIVLFAGLRERLDLMDVPAPFKGVPIALITAGLLALAFLGFSGMIKID